MFSHFRREVQMARVLTIEEKALAAEAAHAAERARRPDAVSISVYVDNAASSEGMIGYHAVVRIDAQLRLSDMSKSNKPPAT